MHQDGFRAQSIARVFPVCLFVPVLPFTMRRNANKPNCTPHVTCMDMYCTSTKLIMSAVWARKAADSPCMYDAYLNASVNGNLSLSFKTEKRFGRDILYATRANVKKRVQKVIHSCELGGYAFLFFSFPSPPSARRTPSTLSSPLTHRRPHHPHCNSRRPSFC